MHWSFDSISLHPPKDSTSVEGSRRLSQGIDRRRFANGGSPTLSLQVGSRYLAQVCRITDCIPNNRKDEQEDVSAEEPGVCGLQCAVTSIKAIQRKDGSRLK